MSTVWLGIGSNRERERYIRAGIHALHQEFARVTQPMAVSRVFESDAVGFSGRRFYNLVARVETSLSISDVSAVCKQIERDHGHSSNAARYSPRTLDIDLLMYDDTVCDSPVQLPRGEILENAFVLWPLAELAPTLRHPISGQTFAQHWQNYRGQQVLEPVEFQFENLPFLKIYSTCTGNAPL
ncbi:MAG: 2-amino-4-hydroxy-6-hydroxymethyldihydropteridine diphosphokinase [Gammaproteobacteria bacterium]|jgi:2-amino-4-hydroxy-6-hydroxymethyldihydropteridine diphosphokinase|nr:2-amino-4-hydroxy-6-hydroxymethyldihydropteridine diphosphokinase [Gammaproteobacteria bacterium]